MMPGERYVSEADGEWGNGSGYGARWGMNGPPETRRGPHRRGEWGSRRREGRLHRRDPVPYYRRILVFLVLSKIKF